MSRFTCSRTSRIKLFATIGFCASILMAWAHAASAAIPQAEHDALMALFSSTAGAGWADSTHWGGALGTENTWFGVTCDAANTHVVQLLLEGNQLTGPIPPDIADLPELQVLDLGSNWITGDLPIEISDLAKLRSLRLGWNQITGAVPVWLTNLTNLEELDLCSNQVMGGIPPQLGGLAKLKTLNLSNDMLPGPIPIELMKLANLEYLYLYDNQLSGSIPSQLGALSNLRVLQLSTNCLSGPIPSSLGSLTKLVELRLDSNVLTGGIPQQLTQLLNLQVLDLMDNRLTGIIPAGFGGARGLQQIVLGHNQLSGSIPSDLGILTNVWWMDLGVNNLSGTIPPQLGNMAALQWLSLGGNQLSGTIPPQLGNLSNLQDLSLESNHLTGALPAQLGNLTNLDSLYASNNKLSGPLPAEIGNLSNVTAIFLENNQISGGLPYQLANLPSLIVLRIDGNKLSGSIPSSLQTMHVADGALDIRWNALYSSDPSLIAYLNQKQMGGDWQSTQTVAPTNVSALATGPGTLQVSWTPILYTSDPGGYRVYASQTPGGPYAPVGTVADKGASFMNVTGLLPGTNYCFIVRSFTNPHPFNQSALTSDPSAEACAMVSSGLNFYDDYGRSQFCVESLSGAYTWRVLSGSGAGNVYGGVATVVRTSPSYWRFYLACHASPCPLVLNVTYLPSAHSASGQLQDSAGHVISNLFDRDTTNDPPCP